MADVLRRPLVDPRSSGAPGDGFPGTAVDLLRRSLDGTAGLLTLGPLTNVAEALRVDPSLASRIPRAVSMAGAIEVPGNAPNGVAEYNVWIDPLAAEEVFDAVPVELVPLDASVSAPATPFFLDALGAHLGTPEARAVDALLRANPQIEQGTSFFWDPLAAALLVDPALATWKEARVLVTASQDSGAGWITRWQRGQPMRYASQADGLGFERAYLSAISGSDVRRVRPPADLSVTIGRGGPTLHGALRAGAPSVISFGDGSSKAFTLVIGALHGIRYGDLLSVLGPPGSIVRRVPKGFAPVVTLRAWPGQTAFARSTFDPGVVGVFVLLERPHDSAKVWPVGRVVVPR